MTQQTLTPRPIDGEPTSWINASGMADEQVLPSVREVAYQLNSWVQETRAMRGRSSLFDRRGYVASDNPYSQMIIARKAVAEDDIVAGVAEVTEGLIFQGTKWEAENPDDADVFNQMSRDLNMDDVLRMAYRDLFTYSQVVFCSFWGNKTYQVRGRTAPTQQTLTAVVDPVTGVASYEPPRDPVTNQVVKPPTKGAPRRKKYDIWVPTRISVLDSCKVVPVGRSLWGQDRLAWIATKDEMRLWEGVYMGTEDDATLATLVIGVYRPSEDEEIELANLGIDPSRLLELNPQYVWRHTYTRPSYERWATNRMKSVFRLLDMKQQLMDSDRAALVGAANYIVLVKKGSEKEPAVGEELSNLKEGMKTVARMPVIISDHRLEIEIITPKLDMTLVESKYDTLDRRILMRLLGALSVASSSRSGDNTLTVGRMIGRVLESKRLMLKRTFEQYVARAVVDHPMNAGKFDAEPNLTFTPRNVQLDSDAQIIQAVMALAAKNDLSRETELEYFGFDQEVEAQRKIEEEESGLNAVFQTAIPFSASGTQPIQNGGGMPPGAFGAQGGRPSGGGKPKDNAAEPGKGSK